MTLKPNMRHTANYEIGLDEAGRGPCFGRLYVAGVVWPKHIIDAPLIKDSKLLNSKTLNEAYKYIINNVPVGDRWISYSEVEEINEHGPLKADILAMHRCLDLFPICPDHILIDGNYFKPSYVRQGVIIDHSTVIKGDSKYYSIAAASILAKWHRDQYIHQLCNENPILDQRYGINSNKGYLTKKHSQGIKEYGITIYHRCKYKCCIQAAPKEKIRPIIKLKNKPVIKLKR